MTAVEMLLGAAASAFGPPPLTPTLLLASPHGGGVLSGEPHAAYANGKTHFGWVNGSSGDYEVATYDHAAGTISSANSLHAFGSVETHRIGALIVRSSDAKLLAAYGGHSEAFLYRRVSASANTTAGTWPAETDEDGSLGGTAYQFPTLCELTGVAGSPLYWLYEDRTGGSGGTSRLCFSVSTDQGATWSAQTVLFSHSTSTFPSWRIGSDTTKIHVTITPTDSYTTTPSLYHFYIDGTDGTYHQSDGTAITSPPFDTTDLTQVYDGSGDGVFPAGCVVNGGNPTAIFYTKVDGTHNAIKRAQLSAGVWTVDTVLASCGVHPADRFSTGLTILEDGATVYLGDLVSGTVEIFRYDKIGGVWTATPITSSSAAHNCQVQAVKNGSSRLPVLWFQGTLTSSSSFALATYGLVG